METQWQIKQLVEVHKNSENSIRFEFEGSEEKLRALDKKIFKDTGIDIVVKFAKKFDFENLELEVPKITERYSRGDIENIFIKFCKEKDLNHMEGAKLLGEFFESRGYV